VNVLKLHLQATVTTLLERGKSQREIHRLTGIDRKTIRKYEHIYHAQQVEADSNSPAGNALELVVLKRHVGHLLLRVARHAQLPMQAKQL
jgi:hypothetical protein